MVEFTLHTPATAPEGSRERLENAEKSMGFVPALWAAQAEAPALLEGYQTLANIFDKTSLDKTERQIVLMTSNYENECHFCMAAHTAISKSQGIDDAVIDALRNNTPLPNEKYEALRTFTRKVVQERGWVEPAEVDVLINAGYTRQTALEVVLGVGLKVLSNYTNHIVDTPVNEQFQPFAWSKSETVAVE
ncbi:MAG: carboxymuconolactone decarboxylase family protein [Pseudomonadota bacterium]|nr:carboxymuconolactone decarboxylase family protein [Pseudomonadota bacterium]